MGLRTTDEFDRISVDEWNRREKRMNFLNWLIERLEMAMIIIIGASAVLYALYAMKVIRF